MESSLTQQEMNAVMQLIQLSSGDSAADFHFYWVDFPAAETKEMKAEREESVGETTTASSSSVVNPEKSPDEALPRRRKRVLPLSDIYRRTAPLINNRTLKRSKI